MGEPLLMPSTSTITDRLPAVGNVVKVIVNEVASTEVTVPTPEDNSTSFVPLGSKPKPAIVKVLALASWPAPLSTTTGTTVATSTADPLLAPSTETMTASVPTLGRELSDMVSEVAVADVTVPTPEESFTLLVPLGSNPTPRIVKVEELAASEVLLSNTTGRTVATSIALPLLTPSTETMTVKLPAVGAELKVMVSDVAVTLVTLPMPEDNSTVLVPVGSNPKPSMVKLLELAAMLEVFWSVTGRIVAT
jgi:hypothetical protein